MLELVLAATVGGSAISPGQLARPIGSHPGFGVGNGGEKKVESTTTATTSQVGNNVGFTIDDWRTWG